MHVLPITPPDGLPEPPYTRFVQAAAAHDKNYNEFSAGQQCRALLAAVAIALRNSPFAVKVDYRQYSYVTSDNLIDGYGNHYTQVSTIDGGSAFTPVFLARQSSLDARLEYQVAAPKIYVGVGYLQTSTNYGYPHLGAVGVGLEKLPDLNARLTPYGSAFYYPSASGNYTVSNAASSNNNTTYKQVYAIVKYDVGLAYSLNHFPIYIYGGFSGDRYSKRQNAPIDQTHGGPYLGLGVKF